jgi:1-acyl-sn-glycerol-3-phosphate acyltransferase
VSFVRSLGVWIVICLATILVGIPAILLALVPPRGRWFLLPARAWAWLILKASGVRLTVLHPERLASGTSFVIAPNHESFYDIPVLFWVLSIPVRFLAKRNLFRLPFLGWAMAAAGFVPVDRGDPGRSAATIDAALRRLRHGRSLIVFPEETRTRTGELLPFKAGAALLAIRSGLPLLPVGIAGTFRIQRRGGFSITPSAVAVAIGEPIDVGERSVRERVAVTEALRVSVASLREEAKAAVEYNPGREAR